MNTEYKFRSFSQELNTWYFGEGLLELRPNQVGRMIRHFGDAALQAEFSRGGFQGDGGQCLCLPREDGARAQGAGKEQQKGFRHADSAAGGLSGNQGSC